MTLAHEKAKRIQDCAAWIAQQPETNDQWINFDARKMLTRLWEKNDDEMTVLRQRIVQLETDAAKHVLELQSGDKLVLQVARRMNSTDRQTLVEQVEGELMNPDRKVVILDSGSQFVILRATTRDAALTSEKRS